MKNSTRLFDFDKTIYDGDCSVDFFFFTLRRYPSIVRYIPIQVLGLFACALGRINKTRAKELFFIFLRHRFDRNGHIEAFWRAHKHKLKKWYLEEDISRDIIISASPEFLVRPICQDIGVPDVIATNMNIQNGAIKGLNCYGEEKVRRLRAAYGELDVTEAFSDSLSDLPMLQLAKKPMMVIGNQRIPLKEYKPSRLMSRFKDRAFLAFIIIGCVNAVLGIGLSMIASLFIVDPRIAFVCGYGISLVISYILNSKFVFGRTRYSVKKFLYFCFSYIPNFLIQLVIIHYATNQFDLHKFLAYMIAVGIGVPVTYLLLTVITFTKKESGETGE